MLIIFESGLCDGELKMEKGKDLNNFFRQNATFIVSDKTESGSAEEQPARDSQTDENNKAVEIYQPLSKNYFQSNA